MFFASHARQTDTVIAPKIAVNPPEASESWLYVRKYVDWVFGSTFWLPIGEGSKHNVIDFSCALF